MTNTALPVNLKKLGLVPDGEGRFTSDHGWAPAQDVWRPKPLTAKARQLGVRVSLFMDPNPDTMALARDAGADRVQLYTEPAPHAKACGGPQQAYQTDRCGRAAPAALDVGLGVNAGHGLSHESRSWFLAMVPEVSGVSIGHALTSDALELGCAAAVADYLRCIDGVAVSWPR